MHATNSLGDDTVYAHR